jgi:hypothetical protein
VDSLREQAEKTGKPFGKEEVEQIIYAPERRDPRAFIIPPNQYDYLTAIKFVNTLLKLGITVHRSKSEFFYGRQKYSIGSFVVFTAQAFRPQIMSMFEPQYPDHTGGDPGGYTLAYQMGVNFIRVQDELKGSFEKLSDYVTVPSRAFEKKNNVAGYTWIGRMNDAFTVAQLLLAEGVQVFRTEGGDFFVKASASNQLAQVGKRTALSFVAVSKRPKDTHLIHGPRIAIVEKYGGSIPAGWYRFLLDQYKIPYTVIGPWQLEDADTLSKFTTVLIFQEYSSPLGDDTVRHLDANKNLPAKYQHRGWAASSKYAVPTLKAFVNQGGTLLIGGAENTKGMMKALDISVPFTTDVPRKVEVSGAMLQMHMLRDNELTKGLPDSIAIVIPPMELMSFDVNDSLKSKGILPVTEFKDTVICVSGKTLGEQHLKNTAPIIEVNRGKGRIILYGVNPNFRYQSQTAFKLFFNALYP